MYKVHLDKWQLPITPSAITIKRGNKNEVVTLMDGAELNILRQGSLREIEFEFLLPYQDYPFEAEGADGNAIVNGSLSAWYNSKTSSRGGIKALDESSGSTIDIIKSGALGFWNNGGEKAIYSTISTVESISSMFGVDIGRTGTNTVMLMDLELLKQSGLPFQFIVTRGGELWYKYGSPPYTNITVSLEDYTIKEDAEKYGMDICVDVKLKEYVYRQAEYTTVIPTKASQSSNAIKKNSAVTTQKKCQRYCSNPNSKLYEEKQKSAVSVAFENAINRFLDIFTGGGE